MNGQWQFASGVHNAQIFGATVRLFENGEQVDELNRYAVVPAEQIEIVDTWHVAGLRGSGSHDVRLTGHRRARRARDLRHGRHALRVPAAAHPARHAPRLQQGPPSPSASRALESTSSSRSPPRSTPASPTARSANARSCSAPWRTPKRACAACGPRCSTSWRPSGTGSWPARKCRPATGRCCRSSARMRSAPLPTPWTPWSRPRAPRRTGSDIRWNASPGTCAWCASTSPWRPITSKTRGRVLLGLEPEGLMLRIR